MNLGKKKNLAAKTFNIGKSRVIFVKSRLDEIKNAITKQDMRDLHSEGAIIIRNVKGRKKIVKNRNKSMGNVRINVNVRKRDYMILTRKLRAFVQDLKKQRKLSDEKVKDIRKKIKNRFFKSKSHLNEYLKALKWKK